MSRKIEHTFDSRLLTKFKKQQAVIEAIVTMQTGWMEAFAERYPLLSANARSIHTQEDRKKRREEIFPADCEKAYGPGQSIASA